MRRLLLVISLLAPTILTAQTNDRVADTVDATLQLARIEYDGGGDWYNSPTALPNLATFLREQFPIELSSEQQVVRLAQDDLGRFPMLFLTGHGTVRLSGAELEALRSYLERGGFLWVDDDYGLDATVRPLLQSLWPDRELITVPPDHSIYHVPYRFDSGRPPKVHEHDGEAPEGLGIFIDGRLAVLYTYESNPSDGWAYDEHENPQEIVKAALQFGANVVIYLMTSIE